MDPTFVPPADEGLGGFDDMPAPEDAKIEEFNRTWEESLAKKEAEEAEHKAALREKATNDLEAMKEERELLRERNSSRNREHEQTLCEQIEADIDGSGNSWERVAKLVDMSGDADGVDNSRMRAIFIKKKNEGN